MSHKNITIIVPALNEEANLYSTIEKIKSGKDFWNDIYIHIFNDGSTDNTMEVAESCRQLQEPGFHISVTHHKKPKNIGFVFKAGLKKCNTEFVMMIHGQNDITHDMLNHIFTQVSDNDILIPYPSNDKERPFLRYTISKTYTFITNSLSGLRLKYFNHYAIFKTKKIKEIDTIGSSFAFQAEIIISLIKKHNATFKEVAIVDVYKDGEPSKAFRLKNIFGVLLFFIKLSLKKI